jgi:hypothetical protein
MGWVTKLGHWEEIKTQVWDTVVTPCDTCGQVVARRLWVADVDGERHRFCSTTCEELYRSYVVGRRRELEPKRSSNPQPSAHTF